MDWYDFLYILGVNNENDYDLNLHEFRELCDEYNRKFPDYPLDSSFFEDNDQYEQARLIDRAIKTNEPIRRFTR